MPTLVNWLEESASNNARSLGASVHNLLEHNITWVMHRMQLRVFTIPRHKEQVEIDTWPSGIDKYFTYRDFVVYDSQQNIVAEATTTWVVLDMAARKMIAIPDFIHAMDFVPNKPHLPRASAKIKPTGQEQHILDIVVRKGDLDQNLHVNNARYFQWILEGTPSEFEQLEPKSIDIIFKAEAYASDELSVLVSTLPANATSNIIRRSTDGSDLVHAVVQY